MARVGLSYPRYAKYSAGTSGITYSGGASLGKAVSVSVELNEPGDNILYADNGPAESDKRFNGGTLTLGTDDLYDAAAVDILGWTQSTTGEILRKANVTPGYMGVGFVVSHIRAGADAYTGVVLTKVQFSDPGLSVETQGETISWQTPELKATILKDDSDDAVWCRQETFTTAASAQAYVDSALSITG